MNRPQEALNRDLFHAYNRDKPDLQAMEAALAAGANPDMQVNDAKRTLLHEAAQRNQVGVVNLLLSWDANPDAADFMDETPMFIAVRGSALEALNLLFEAGADAKAVNKKGKTANWFIHQQVHLGDGLGDYEALIDQLFDEYGHQRPMVNPFSKPESLKERLFAFNERMAYAPLDNPEVWKKFDAIGEILLKQGTPIEKEEWFEMNARGERWLDVAIRFRQLDKVLDHLHAQGERLELDSLIGEDGQANELLQAIANKGQARHLFTPNQLIDEGMDGMQKLMRALPETVRPQIQNLHQLKAQMQQMKRDQDLAAEGISR